MSATSALLAGALGVPVEPDREQARRLLQDELADPVYAQAEPNLLERFVSWVWDQLSSVEVPNGPGGTTLLVVTVVVLVVAVAVAFGFAGPLRLRGRTGAGGRDLFADTTSTAARHRSLAEQHAADQRWEDAVRERFRAVVRSMEERAILDPRPGRTAHEAAAEAGPSLPEAAADLLAAAQVFDDVVYGERATTESGYSRVRAVDELLGRSRPVAAGVDALVPAAPR